MKDVKTKSRKNQPQTSKDVIISDVKNLHELPIFLASNPKDFAIQIQLEPTKHLEGGTQERVINISALSVLNSVGRAVPLYLNTITLEFWFWLCYLWQQMPEPERSKGIVRWTRYQILTLMGRSTGGSAYQIHDDHLTRLAGVSSEIKDLFYNEVDKEQLKTVRRFVILSALELTEKKDGQIVLLDECKAIINPLLVNNFLYKYTKPVNLSVYSSIHWQAGIARKLYTRLDSQFSHYNRFEMTTERFFRESGIVGSKYKKPSARKQNLEKSIKQLLGKKFTSNKIIKGYKFEKTTDGKDWKVIIWAHQMTVVSLPHVADQPASKKAKASKPKQPKSKEPAAKPQGLAPIKQIVAPEKVTKEASKKSSSTSKELKTFLDTFGKLFKYADKERIYRSRSVKAKAQEFINQYKIEKSLDFLRYCSELSRKNQFGVLAKANTPAYLLGFKVGEELLTNSWLHDRASELNRKREEKAQVLRRKTYERDIFSKEKNPEYQQYINSFISELSELQQLDFEEYFQHKESKVLAEKGKSYQQLYSKSKLLKKQFNLDCLMKFSKEFLPKPVYTFEEWVKVNYPDEHKRFYL
ncbi:MAG: hypothetical protein AAF298_02140 [Cyanobacteria bacterium P01_A01_bin.40]